MPTNKRTPRAVLQNGPAFTSVSLRVLLAEKIIRGKQRVPGKAEVEELARILNGWKQHFLHDQNIGQAYNELQKSGLETLNKLNDVFSQLKAMNTQFENAAAQDDAPPHFRAILRERLTEIDRVLKFIRSASCGSVSSTTFACSVLTESLRLTNGGWKWLAHVLPQDFLNAMQATNPGFKIGISTNGPIARFIEAVVPAITGEHPTANSIATQLKNIRAQVK